VGFQVSCPTSGEKWSGAGILRNISMGGLYFTSAEPLPLEVGHIRDFTFDTTDSPPARPPEMELTLRGRVMRIERPGLEAGPFGVALQFVHPLMQ
jgi:hypothetical protein